MKQTTYCTVAFLSCCNHEKPTLEIRDIPSKYTKIIIKDYYTGAMIVPAGFDESGLPYFSDEFYRKLRMDYDEIVKYDEERARNLFWFDIEFVK